MSERYDEWSADMTDDVPFYVRLAGEADGPVVELAVGNGRVAVPVGRAIGRPVIGIDSSPSMLEQARTAAAGARGGARPASRRHARLRAPRACGTRLLPVPGAPAPADVGRPAADLRTCRRLAPARRPVRVERLCVRPRDCSSPRRGARARARSPTIHYAVGDNRIDIVLDGGGTSSLWWATKNEWLGLLDVAGLELETLDGDFAGTPVDDESREYVFVARRP